MKTGKDKKEELKQALLKFKEKHPAVDFQDLIPLIQQTIYFSQGQWLWRELDDVAKEVYKK